MKKLLSVAVALLAMVAVADPYSPTIGVTKITTSSVNAIIPVPYTSLADATAEVSLSDLVRTTNLKSGTWLLAFDGTQYEGWTLQSDGGSWTSAQYASDDLAGTTIAAGASKKTLKAGGAFWIILPAAESTDIYVYGSYSSSVTSTIPAGKTLLIANPKQAAATPSISGASNGDVITIINGATTEVYSFNGTAWGSYVKQATGLPTWTAHTFSSMAQGTGFWYKSAAATGDVTISWQ